MILWRIVLVTEIMLIKQYGLSRLSDLLRTAIFGRLKQGYCYNQRCGLMLGKRFISAKFKREVSTVLYSMCGQLAVTLYMG